MMQHVRVPLVMMLVVRGQSLLYIDVPGLHTLSTIMEDFMGTRLDSDRLSRECELPEILTLDLNGKSLLKLLFALLVFFLQSTITSDKVFLQSLPKVIQTVNSL
jgi:hypothetical protein